MLTRKLSSWRKKLAAIAINRIRNKIDGLLHSLTRSMIIYYISCV